MKRPTLLTIALTIVLAASPAVAQAGSNFGTVVNKTGWSVFVDCNLGDNHGKPSPDHTIYQQSTGRKYRSDQFSGCSDADAFYLRGSAWRCVNLNGWHYRAKPGHWFKIPGLTYATTWTYKGCSSAPWVSESLRRLT